MDARRRLHRARRSAAAVALLALCWTPVALADDAQDPAPRDPAARLEALFATIDERQQELETLTARFEQRKEGPLLLEPEVATGRYSYRAPDRMAWDYETPDRTLIVLRGSEILTWYRDLGYAERVDGGRQTKRLWKALGSIYLGTPKALGDLRRYFHLHATFPEAPDPYRLELEPRDSRVARRLSSLVVWLDRERLLPVAVRQVGPDGSVTEFRFEEIQTDIEIPAERFDPQLPPDLELRSPPAEDR